MTDTLTLEEAIDRFDADNAPLPAADLLTVAAVYWRGGLITDKTFDVTIATVRDWLVSVGGAIEKLKQMERQHDGDQTSTA